jgi:Bacterial protein of unknown function (DUF853)
MSGRRRRGDNLADAMAKSAARAMGSSLGRQIVRGVLGSRLGTASANRLKPDCLPGGSRLRRFGTVIAARAKRQIQSYIC